MLDNVESSRIRLVRGDTLSLNLQFEEEINNALQEVYFSCKALDLKEALIKNEDKWTMTIYNTSSFKCLNADYDITLYFNNGQIYTVIYRGAITVLDKTNIVEE